MLRSVRHNPGEIPQENNITLADTIEHEARLVCD